MPNNKKTYSCTICLTNNIQRRYTKICQTCNNRICLVCLIKSMKCPFCRSVFILENEFGNKSFLGYCKCDDSDSDYYDSDYDEHDSGFCQNNYLLKEINDLQMENFALKTHVNYKNKNKMLKNDINNTKSMHNFGTQTDNIFEITKQIEKYCCDCGVSVNLNNKKRHLDSLKHKYNIVKQGFVEKS